MGRMEVVTSVLSDGALPGPYTYGSSSMYQLTHTSIFFLFIFFLLCVGCGMFLMGRCSTLWCTIARLCCISDSTQTPWSPAQR